MPRSCGMKAVPLLIFHGVGKGQSLRFSLTRLIAEGIILLPEHGAAELIIQLVNFGAEESSYSRADTRQRKPMLRVQISRYDRGEVSLKAELLFLRAFLISPLGSLAAKSSISKTDRISMSVGSAHPGRRTAQHRILQPILVRASLGGRVRHCSYPEHVVDKVEIDLERASLIEND